MRPLALRAIPWAFAAEVPHSTQQVVEIIERGSLFLSCAEK